MPGLVVFRRRWSVGSDDLVVPGAFLLISHFICMIVVLLSILIFQYNTAILCVRLLFYHQIGYVLILFFSVCVETGICVISMRGSILDSDARSTINVWIYLKSMVIFFDITWLALGTIWLSSYYPEAAIDEPKKIFLVIIICNWAVVMMTFTTIWCTFDTAGRSWVKMKKYQRSMRETESRFNYKRSNSMNRNWRQRKVMRAYQDSWDHRCRLLFCCMSSSERNRNSFTDIARLLSDFFRELDVVPSDVVAGLVLLRKFQRVEREAVVRQRKNGTYEFLSGVPITERTQFLALNDAKNFDFFQTVIHYMYFAQGAYGWPMYLLINRAKVWNLLPHLKCLGCCCRRSGDQAEVIKDNCCLCNYAALKKTLQVGDIEIIYATYHVDVGETPFFVAIDFTQKKVVVSIRGTLSMKDILTDLNAEGEVLPLQPPRDDWLGHKGMVQAAIYIRQKLTEEQLIEKALSYDTARQTQTFDLVLVGHSLGAGTAAILAILMKPDYPTLQCFSYSPPGGLLSYPAVEYSKSFITSVVLGKDVVPRIGLNQMEALRADLINAIQRSVDPKWKTISCSVICCCGCAPEPTSVVEMSSKDTHINQYQEERDSARTGSTHPNDSSIALTLHQPLYPPGRIIHVVRHHPKPDENVLKSRDPVYQAIWADNKDFDQVLISPSMLQDHMPDAVLAALKKVVTTSGPRKPQRHVSNAFSSNDVSAGDFGDSDRSSLHSKSKDLAAQAQQHSRSNSNFSNSIILTPTTQHKLCLETSFTNLQHTQQLLQQHATNAHHQPHSSSMSKTSSTVGSIFGRQQFDSLSGTQYDNISTSVMDESISTTIARRSPSDAGTVIVMETEPRLKTVAFDMEMIQMHEAMAMKSPSPQVPTRSILHRQSSARTADKRPKVMPFTTLRRASDVQAGDSDWGGLAPLASPETLSEISSISSRTSVPHSLANSIERYLHKMNGGGGAAPENGQIGVPTNRLEDIFESQLHTPKVMRRAPKFSENLAHCAEDTRNVDQYKRMGRVFITFPRIFPDYDERNRHRPSSSLDSDSDDSFESALSVEKAARGELHRPVQQRRITLPSSPTPPPPLHHAEAEHPLQQNKLTSKSADQLDDESASQAVPATKKLTFSDSEILNDDCSSHQCPACPCHGSGATSKVDCCRRIDHSQCIAPPAQLLPSTSSVNTTGSVDTTYYSANSSLEQFITPARHADVCTLRPGVLESHFPVYEKTVAAPEETPRRDVVGGRVRKRLSSEEFIFTRADDYPLIVQIAERCSPQPGSLSRKRKGCVYPAGNRILLTPQKTAATTATTTTTSTTSTPTRQHTAIAATPRKFSNTNSESSV